MRHFFKSLTKRTKHHQTIFRQIDIFGQNILLNLNGEDHYKTAFGGVMTIMILFIVVLFFQSNISDFVNKVNITSEITEVFEDSPDEIYLNETNFMFAVAIEQNNFNTHPYFNITLRPRQYTRYSNGTLEKNEQFIDLIPCTLDRFQTIFSKYNVNFTTQFTEIGLDTWLCPSENFSMAMKGRYTNQYFNFVKVVVTACSNDTSTNSQLTWKPICAGSDEIDSWLESQRSFRLKFYITNKVINPQNGDNYVQAFLDDELFFSFVPGIIGKEPDIFFTKYVLQTDQSLIPGLEDIETMNHMLKKPGDFRDQTVYGEDQYAALYLRRSPYTYQIERSYQQIDKLLSSLGGFANITMIVLGFFVAIYNKQQYLIELANEVYDFHFGDETKSKFERQELMKQITQIKSHTRIVSQQRFSPVQSISQQNQSIGQGLLSIRSKYPQDCTLVLRNENQISMNEIKKSQFNKNNNSKDHEQPIGDQEIEWQSLDRSEIQSNNLTNNINHTEVMFNSTAKFNPERINKTQQQEQQQKIETSFKQPVLLEMQKQIVKKIGIQNKKEYLTKQIQMMLDKSKPIIFTFKFILHQLFCGKFFIDKNCILLDKAIKKINQDLDICVLIDKINEINFIKELLLEKDQQILFNFAPKEVISIDETTISTQIGRRASKRAFTKRIGVQFSDVAKMMVDKKFKKGQFVNPGMQIYYKLYQAYESVLLSDDKNNRFNTILIQKLGSEVKEVFEISQFIQENKNQRIIDRWRRNKDNQHEEIDEMNPALLSIDQKDIKQHILSERSQL